MRRSTGRGSRAAPAPYRRSAPPPARRSAAQRFRTPGDSRNPVSRHRPVGDLEVVDLLELGLDLGVLVVLVRRVRRPVATGRDHLARDERVGLEHVGGGEVVHLAAAVPAPRNSIGTSSARCAEGQSPTGAGAAERDTGTGGVVTRYALSRPRYPKSVGPWKTDCLPAKVNSRSSHDTATEPDSGTTGSRRRRIAVDGFARSEFGHRQLASAQPADSGVTATVTGNAAGRSSGY